MNQQIMLGMWPFEDAKERNLADAIDRAAFMLEGKVKDQFRLSQKLRLSISGMPWANDYGRFVNDYIQVAKSLQRPYSNSADFYSVWEPAFSGRGWSKDITEIMLRGMRELIAQGAIDPYIANPAKNEAPGGDDTPIGNAAKTVLKYAVIGVVAYFAITKAPLILVDTYKRAKRK